MRLSRSQRPIGPRSILRTGLVLVLLSAWAGGLTAAQRASASLPPPQDICPEACPPREGRPFLWIGPEEIATLPMSGAGWDARGAPWFQNRGVYYYAQQDTSHPLLGDQGDDVDVYVLAKALVWLRLVQEPMPPEDPEPYRAAVQDACLAARGTELWGPDRTSLALGRNLFAFVLAANIIEWDESVPWRQEVDFRRWVDAVRGRVLSDGGTVRRTLVQAHETRPNNWGLMCGASRLAAALYLCDRREELRCWDVFRRWLGDTTSPFAFEPDDWGELSWQADPTTPVGINPFGAKRLDCGSILRSIGGAMPDDMRRAGSFATLGPCDPGWSWPAFADASDRNYNWNAMQAVLAQAVLHSRRGRDPWSVETLAIGRAIFWLYRELEFPATHPDAGDDDYWQTHLGNQIYPGLMLPEPVATKPGEQVGYTDWTTLDPSWP